VAAVELAVLLVPLVLLTFGAVEFGRAIQTFNTLAKAARDAARHLSQQPPGVAAVQAQARCLAVHGDPDCAGTLLAPGLTVAQVAVCDAVSCAATHALQPTAAGAVNLVSVTIRGYTWTSVLDFIVPDLGLRPIAVTMRGVQ
jgi:Flp pilus assembly protein TadG